jgi:SH3-like domain-containing protein
MKQILWAAASVVAMVAGIRAAGAEEVLPVAVAVVVRDPGLGAVTNLPVPRYVSLKTGEGNARRGPGLTHRIDWVFTRAGMPLRITAEFEHWRRIEDQDGMGGWVHYSLLSGVRTALITVDMAEFRAGPDAGAEVVAQAELGVVAKLLNCTLDWCRISADGEKGWVPKTALWGVDPGEIIE